MTHTPGKKAKLHTQWPAHVRDEGGGGIYLVADNGRYIAHFFEPKRRNVYNALRIAALWNMAERLRLTTEEIESGNVEAKLKAAPYMLEALESINYLINNSTGVAGWHLNGDIEPWERTEVVQEISDAIAVAKESPTVRDEIIRKARGEDA